MADPVYEYVKDEEVVERVQLTHSSDDYENTRIGSAALDTQAALERGDQPALDQHGGYWRHAVDEAPPRHALPEDETHAPPTQLGDAAVPDPARSTDDPDVAESAAPADTTEE